MRTKYLLFAMFFLFSKAKSQSIIGLWQEDSPEVTDAYFNTYEFKVDGTFQFNVNSYFGLSRVVSFGGNYKIDNNKIQLSVLYTVDIVGGRLVRSEFAGTATHLWVIEGGQKKKNILPQPYKSTLVLEFSKSKKADDANSQLILLDESKFYRIPIE